MTTTTAVAPTTNTWTLDASHSLVEFAAKHLMLTTVKGRFPVLSGAITLNEETPAQSAVTVEFDVASLDTRAEKRDAHLRSADFLDVDRFPTMSFRSVRLNNATLDAGGRFQLVGLLTIRDVTREITLDVTVDGRGRDPWGGERVSFSAETALDRRDFGLTWNAALETGGVLVSNELKISLEIQAVRAA